MQLLGLMVLTMFVGDLVDSLNSLAVDRAVKFSVVMKEVFSAAESARALTPDMVDNVERLVNVADEYSMIKYSLFGGDGSAQKDFVDLLKASQGGSAAASGGASGGTTVVLELDGKELGRTVETLLSKRNKLRSKA